MTHRTIPPQSGTAFTLKAGQRLTVIDPEGQQVSDLVAFNAEDTDEWLSSGRTLDYASKFLLSTGDILYSNRSSPMLTIERDDVGRHDFLLAPCSKEMFAKLYGHTEPHRGCFGNLAAALEPYGIAPDRIPTAFNVFMNVQVNGTNGQLSVEPPLSKAGDSTVFLAQMDLVVALTACSAGQSNNFRFKPIQYRVE
ncbi:urea carboxylase-associated family protein [Luteibacter jiangsuensis]|uniref:Urea carboxylase-associated family protein n=1 Tax=Luteibacter jiangsuensis TaxID=637577 RepID=A0ABX0Q628_9GAMM|nr:urea carboxylase-associated family protein [Luteibacter jiangsuensis]NID05842.1 urea carboxylase-associated family protein [Luteibacter jiangsuensis]